MLFWTRRTYCFLLCLSSNLAGVLPFRNRALGGVSAAESPTALDGKASIPHPSISLQLFAISWFEGAERPPVLKPMRHRLGMNLAGVRNRALGGVSAAASPTVLDGKASTGMNPGVANFTRGYLKDISFIELTRALIST